MTYKTLRPQADIQFIDKEDLKFYKEMEKTEGHIKVFEMDEDDFLYLNWNKMPRAKEAEIVKLAQKVKAETKEVQENIGQIGTQNKIAEYEENWNLSGTLYECILRYADRLSEAQLNEILLGMEGGLTEKQVKSYFALTEVQMNRYRRAYLFSQKDSDKYKKYYRED